MNDYLEKSIRTINRHALDALNSFPAGVRVFEQLQEPYIAGHSIDGVLDAVEAFKGLGRHSTVDILGEESHTIEKAARCRQGYRKLMDGLASRSLADWSTVSMKPTSICIVTNDSSGLKPETGTLQSCLEPLVSYGKERGLGVTLDMEDHNWTYPSLYAAHSIWQDGFDNLGIVLQTRLDRTESDIDWLLRTDHSIPLEKIRVRICIGIYDAPEGRGTNIKTIAKRRLIDYVPILVDGGVYVEVATHDPAVVREVFGKPSEHKLPPDRAEAQFLLNVQNGYILAPELMDAGYTVRWYMPGELVKGEGTPYGKRRLIANPGMVWSGAKNMAQALLHGRKK